MISCPECGTNVVRVHGIHQHLEWVRKHWWAPWEPMVPRGTVTAHDISCPNCLTTYVAHRDGRCIRTPMQQAADMLKAAMAKAAEVSANGGAPPKEKAAPRPMPRPAGDPRVKR